MATAIIIGKVGVTWQGPWSATKADYERLDEVTYLGSTYRVILKTGNVPVGALPTNTTYFEMSAQGVENVEELIKDEDLERLPTKYGTNIFNINDPLTGDIGITEAGALTPTTGFKTSKPIIFDRSLPLTFNLISLGTNKRYRFLDANGVLVPGGVGYFTGNIHTMNPASYPATAVYVQHMFKRDTETLASLAKMQVEQSSTAGPFVPWVPPVIGNVFKVKGKPINNADKEIYTQAQVDSKMAAKADEENANGKTVRAQYAPIRTYTFIDGVQGETGSGFYRYDNGVVTPTTARKLMTWPVNSALKYAITGQINGASLVAVAVFFKQDMTYNGYQERVQTGALDLNRHVLTIPAGTAFVGSGNNIGSVKLVLESFTEIPAYQRVLFSEDVYSNAEIDEKISSAQVGNPLVNKTILGAGDSIQAGDGNGGVGPIEILAADNQMTVFDYAVGGATMGVRAGITNNIPRQIDLAVSNGLKPDYFAFNGFTNDMSAGVPLGVITSGYTAALDKTTAIGAFEYVCKTAKENFPGAKMIYIRPHKMGSRNEADQEAYGAAALAVCAKWSIPVVDIYKEGLLNTYLPVMTKLYTAATDTQPNGDRTHPNGLGYRLFYLTQIAAKLKSL